MKLLRGQILSGVIVLGSLISLQVHASAYLSLQMQAGASQNIQQWWRSSYFTDYLPLWLKAYIPRARVRQMFYGVDLYYEKLRDLCCFTTDMNKLVKEYNIWMQQYKDIINEGTFFSRHSIASGNPDSVLGLWKIIFGIIYEIGSKDSSFNGVISPHSKAAFYLLREIKKIIKNLENIGAQINPLEKPLVEPYELLIEDPYYSWY